MVTAILRNYRQSPRKVRVVANLVRGKSIDVAMSTLAFAGKRAALPLQRLIMSAVANAEQQSLSKDDLIVSSIRVDGGVVLKRMMPQARGRGFPIKKRTSHVIVTLDAKPAKKVKASKKNK